MKTPSVILPLFLALLLSACGRNPDVLTQKGIKALNQGDVGKATSLLTKAAERSLGSEDEAYRWGAAGLAAARAGRGGDAESYLAKALALDGQSFEANYNLGDILISQNRLDEAESYLFKAAEVDPSRTEALEALAGIALRRGDFDSAVEYLNRARNREESARVLTSLAVAGKENYSIEQTRSLLQQAVTLDPAYAPAQLNLASVLDQNRLDPAQAAAHYEAFIRLQPEDDKIPLVHQRLQMMESRVASGDVARPDPVRQDVEDLLTQAADAATRGESPLALQFCLRANAAATRAQRSDLRERALRAATTLVPDSARAHFGLGKFMLAQNRKTEALISFEKAQELAPGWPLLVRPSVTLAAELNQTTLADEMLKSSEKAGFENPDVLLEIGDLYAEALNDEKESRRIYQELLENFPDYEKLSDVQARLNR